VGFELSKSRLNHARIFTNNHQSTSGKAHNAVRKNFLVKGRYLIGSPRLTNRGLISLPGKNNVTQKALSHCGHTKLSRKPPGTHNAFITRCLSVSSPRLILCGFDRIKKREGLVRRGDLAVQNAPRWDFMPVDSFRGIVVTANGRAF